MALEDNVKTFYESMYKTCNECGRKISEISVVAATKCVSREVIDRLPGVGITEVGENRVQEFTGKYSPDSALRWHIIGALQTNKVKYVVGKAAMIQSVDRISLACEIDRLSGQKNILTDVLIEVNIGAEENKSGVMPEYADELTAHIAEFKNVKVCGFMCVPPIGANRSIYEKMYNLYDDMRRKYAGADILSMGMSGDYELAIKCGATMVRPGRALFGERG